MYAGQTPIAGPCKGDPGIDHPRRQLTRPEGTGSAIRDIDVVEDKRQIHRVMGFDAAAMRRALPVERIHKDRRPAPHRIALAEQP